MNGVTYKIIARDHTDEQPCAARGSDVGDTALAMRGCADAPMRLVGDDRDDPTIEVVMTALGSRLRYGRTPQIDVRRHANSIAALEPVVLGGVEQWVRIRGEDAANPLVLFVHRRARHVAARVEPPGTPRPSNAIARW